MKTTPRNKTLSPTRDHQVGLPARRAAADLLDAVLQKHQSLDDVLGRNRTGALFDLPTRDRALARAIVGTSLRRKGQIDRVLETFLEKGLPARAGTLYPILLSGAAQILFMNVPPHAAIDLAVRLAQWDPRAKRYDKLVNAVLRRVSEKGAGIAEALDPARVNTPNWLWQRWVRAWGEDRTSAIAETQLIEPPLDVTVKGDPDIWAEKLGGRVLPTGSVRLIPRGRIEELPGFDEGAWWVQDAAASIPAQLLHDVAGKRVADLCAAPGGKTAQLVARAGAVTAVDLSKNRLARLEENLSRLGLAAETVTADATQWQPDAPFDAVLLDAPCSSTGTIRRHPDVPYLKSDADIAELAALQTRLLDNAVRLLKPGGTLVYSTCSLEPEEGEAQIAALLARNDSLRIEPMRADEPFGNTAWAQSSGVLRTFPFQLQLDSPEWSGMDGFFAARLVAAG
ncbi:16S rRNA (cytosine(967)-C(5))-methyltransferase RsmB [Methyloceanibacter caenitepidi]|uniref:16S rRNA (cytosine(967)-C(5))-methyltransferase n=1 Tax=Methyloceanibacter caenitepidi TaxID=1384459 RepID=A0A0A8JZQ8_9HYPH|nr:16S rRNA (cytosine(967)-C(5))-methyltransferase RsmB [Methyloceanibacter caenitepidi]BAQ15832.1 16S rRNA m(5)C 967 methyltransferase [Methyloceanibacter caenitepidi]